MGITSGFRVMISVESGIREDIGSEQVGPIGRTHGVLDTQGITGLPLLRWSETTEDDEDDDGGPLTWTSRSFGSLVDG